MAQVKYYDKRVGTTYVYDSQSYYDAEKHQSRSKRKLIGKIDPETGEIVPTGKAGRPRKDDGNARQNDVDYEKLYKKALKDLKKKDKKILELEQEVISLKKELAVYKKNITRISELCDLNDR